MTQDPFRDEHSQFLEKSLGPMPSYYALLDLNSTATLEQIRRAYRLKSKLYHPDTTILPPEIAVQKFRDLNTAYATLSNAEHRAWYDKCTESGQFVTFPSRNESRVSRSPRPQSASGGTLDPTERALSPGELFALFLLGITFLVCLVIAIILGVARGEMVLQSSSARVEDSALMSSPSPDASSVKIRTRNDLATGKSLELKEKRLSSQPKIIQVQQPKRSLS